MRNMKAEREKLEAEAAKFRAEAKVQANIAESGRLQVEIDRWRRDRSAIEQMMWQLQPLFAREYWLVGYISYGSRDHPDTISPCIEALSTWSRFAPGCEIKINLNTPGGDTFAGMALFDFLSGLRRLGHTVIINGQGMVASMGSVLMQAASWRTMGHESLMLIHEGGGASTGSFGELQDSMALFSKLAERMAAIFIERSGKISRPDFVSRWTRKDWWLSAPEALDMGFIDEVLE